MLRLKGAAERVEPPRYWPMRRIFGLLRIGYFEVLKKSVMGLGMWGGRMLGGFSCVFSVFGYGVVVVLFSVTSSVSVVISTLLLLAVGITSFRIISSSNDFLLLHFRDSPSETKPLST